MNNFDEQQPQFSDNRKPLRVIHDRKPTADIIAGRQPVMEALRAGTLLEKVVILFGVKGDQIDKIKAMAEGLVKELTLRLEKAKARVRARVEHPFHILKNLFKHRKVRYRGLAKNTAQLHSLFALANLVIARRALLSAVLA